MSLNRIWVGHLGFREESVRRGLLALVYKLLLVVRDRGSFVDGTGRDARFQLVELLLCKVLVAAWRRCEPGLVDAFVLHWGLAGCPGGLR